jgi:hypothetical protein
LTILLNNLKNNFKEFFEIRNLMIRRLTEPQQQRNLSVPTYPEPPPPPTPTHTKNNLSAFYHDFYNVHFNPK